MYYYKNILLEFDIYLKYMPCLQSRIKHNQEKISLEVG